MRIGAIAAAAGVTTKTVRFYEQAGLLPEPPRTGNGYRDYPADTTARLAFIRDAQATGLTLAEIRGVLAIRDSGHTPCRHVTDLIAQHLDHVELRIAELTQTRAALRKLHRKATATAPADCTATEICTILTQTSALLDRPPRRRVPAEYTVEVADAVRRLTLADGGIVVERLVSLADGDRSDTYEILESPFAVRRTSPRSGSCR